MAPPKANGLKGSGSVSSLFFFFGGWSDAGAIAVSATLGASFRFSVGFSVV
jgi:hypothetical protein